MDVALLAAQLRIARDAAAHDHCDVVAQIAAQVAQTDHTYYTHEFLADPTLGYCLGAPGAQPPPLKIEQPVVAPPQLEGTPPLDGSRIAGEVLLGGTGAFVGGAIGVLAAVGLSGGCTGDCLAVLEIGGFVGVTAGASLGVCAVGSQDHQHASYGAAVGAAAVGSFAGLAFAVHQDSRGVGLAAIIATPVISSTLLFNLTRRYDVVPVATGHGIALAGTF